MKMRDVIKAERDVIKAEFDLLQTILSSIMAKIGNIVILIVIAVLAYIILSVAADKFYMDITPTDFILSFALLSIIFLVLTGKIGELSFGSLSLKLREYSMEKIKTDKPEPEEVKLVAEAYENITKESMSNFLEKLPKIKSGLERNIILSIGKKSEMNYNKEILKMYLVTNLFKYVVFIDEDNRFEAFIPAKILRGLLELEHHFLNSEESTVDKINKWRIKNIPLINEECILETTSTKDAINKMECNELEEIAVVDRKKHFIGIINKDKLRLRIANKAVTLLRKE